MFQSTRRPAAGSSGSERRAAVMAQAPRVDRFALRSTVLRGNPQGDPDERDVLVVVPPDYDAGALRYPVVLVLAPFAGFGATLLNRGCWEEGLDQRLARLFAEGCPPALFVLPDASTRLGGSQYVNSSALGRYEDHVVDEVLPEVERRYRTIAKPGGRAVVGRSSGGFGALHLAFQRPGHFAAVACLSGDLGFELSYGRDFPVCAATLERAGGVQPFLDGFFARHRHGGDDFTTISTLALAAAYSPDPKSPGRFALPFDPRTCEPLGDVLARWLAFDPVHRVAREAAALRTLRLLFVDCGTRDEYFLHFGARRFARAARREEVPLEQQEYDDGHRGTSYRYDVAVPRLLKAIDAAGP
jgi:enterochelin esterase family protein